MFSNYIYILLHVWAISCSFGLLSNSLNMHAFFVAIFAYIMIRF